MPELENQALMALAERAREAGQHYDAEQRTRLQPALDYMQRAREAFREQ